MSSFNPSIFREYDIRGTFGQTFFIQDAYEIGLRFAHYLKSIPLSPLVCVGRDGRLSSPDLGSALQEGLREAGANVLDIGVGPTPMLYYATQVTDAVAGIMVTGSHNPPEDNGLKLTLKHRPFFGAQIQELQHTIPCKSKIPGSWEKREIQNQYIDRLLDDLPKFSSRKLKVAWDCGNGATGEIINLLTARLGNESILLNTTIDGTFPAHHPDPTEEKNLEQLRHVVASQGCDIGIAFDGDGDRIGVIDGKGRILWGDQLLHLLADDVLERIPGAKIIADVKCSQGLFDYIEEKGGVPVISKTGHSNIKMLMGEVGASLAGEMSGHMFFADHYYGYDDALYAALRLLGFLETQDKTLAELFDRLPQYHNTPEIRFACDDLRKFQIITMIQKDLKKQGINFLNIDGVRVKTEIGWWLVRASNTQPLLVARCEAYHRDDLPFLIQEMKNALAPYIDVFIP